MEVYLSTNLIKSIRTSLASVNISQQSYSEITQQVQNFIATGERKGCKIEIIDPRREVSKLCQINPVASCLTAAEVMRLAKIAQKITIQSAET